MESGKAVTEVTISAVVIKNDGTRVDLGNIAYWHKNPLKRWAWSVRNAGKRAGEHIANLYSQMAKGGNHGN